MAPYTKGIPQIVHRTITHPVVVSAHAKHANMAQHAQVRVAAFPAATHSAPWTGAVAIVASWYGRTSSEALAQATVMPRAAFASQQLTTLRFRHIVWQTETVGQERASQQHDPSVARYLGIRSACVPVNRVLVFSLR